MGRVSDRTFDRRHYYGATWLMAACLLFWGGAAAAKAQTPIGHGVLAHLQANAVVAFDARHGTQVQQLNPNRDLYLITASDGRTDQALLDEVLSDPTAGAPTLNSPVSLTDAGTNSTLDGQSTASVLNGQSTASVLNGGGSGTTSTTSTLLGLNTSQLPILGGILGPVLGVVGGVVGGLLNPLLGAVLNLNIVVNGSGAVVTTTSGAGVVQSAPTNFYGAVVPSAYPSQTLVGQIQAGSAAHALATGRGVLVALIDNGVDPTNPVLAPVLEGAQGYNFYDHSPDWSAYADLADGPGTGGTLDGQSTASVLNGQSTASVLNGGSCAAEFGGSGSALDQSTASVLNGQSTASVLNGQSTASVLNGAQTQAQAVAVLNEILACDPDFGHGTSVAGLIHLVAPQAEILPIKAFGPGGTADVASIYASITYAIDQHVAAMNLSFSATETTPDIQNAIEEAVSDGIVVVAAAGNSDTSAAVYPASLAGVVGAGAVDGTGSGLPRASFSNFDPGVGQYVDVAVAAPGVSLFTTYPGGGQIWATVTGTSFSTPLVVGEAALLAQLGKSGASSSAAIESATNPAIAGDSQGGLGHGLINVLGALRASRPGLLSLF